MALIGFISSRQCRGWPPSTVHWPVVCWNNKTYESTMSVVLEPDSCNCCLFLRKPRIGSCKSIYPWSTLISTPLSFSPAIYTLSYMCVMFKVSSTLDVILPVFCYMLHVYKGLIELYTWPATYYLYYCSIILYHFVTKHWDDIHI